MAKADSFLVNHNPLVKDTSLINEFIEPKIFFNKLIRHKSELLIDHEIREIDERYDYRPDRLAYDIYGQDFWFPAILVANDLGSLLQFKASMLGYKCKVPSLAGIQKAINKEVQEKFTINQIVDNIFK